MVDIGFLLGLLVATRLLSGFYIWLTKSWDGGVQRFAVVHFISLITAGLLEGTARSHDGNFAGIYAVGLYLVPQIMWFVFDVYCLRQQKHKLFKIVMVTSGVTLSLSLLGIFFLGFFGTSLETTYEEVNKLLKNQGTKNSNYNINREFTELLLKDISLPYVIDDKITLRKITSNDRFVNFIYVSSGYRIDQIEMDQAYWEGYFCAHKHFSRLLVDGANLNFLYVNYKDLILGNYSITYVNCEN